MLLLLLLLPLMSPMLVGLATLAELSAYLVGADSQSSAPWNVYAPLSISGTLMCAPSD